MFGFIHDSLRQLVIRKYGESAWEEVLERCGMEPGKEAVVNQYYDDMDTHHLVESISAISRMPIEEVWESYGGFLIQYTMENGWGDILNSLSNTLHGFLDNLDSLHYFIDHVVYKAGLRGPSFRCEAHEDDTLTLHYYSSRTGLIPIVKGVVREVARRVFRLNIDISLKGRKQQLVSDGKGGDWLEEHVTFSIAVLNEAALSVAGLSDRGSTSVAAYKASILPSIAPSEGSTIDFPPLPSGRKLSTATDNSQGLTELSEILELNDPYNDRPLEETISLRAFSAIAPYHLVFSQDLTILQCGEAIAKYFPSTIGQSLLQLVDLKRPAMDLSFNAVLKFINSVFVLRLIPPGDQEIEAASRSPKKDKRNRRKKNRSKSKDEEDEKDKSLWLKGQMMLLDNEEQIIFMGSPYVTNVAELLGAGLHINSLPLRDVTRDLVLLNQQRLSEVEAHRELEEQTSQVEVMKEEVEREREKARALLKECLPASVALQVKELDRRERLSDLSDSARSLFSTSQ